MSEDIYDIENNERFLNRYNDLDRVINDPNYRRFVELNEDRINNLRKIRNLLVHASYEGERPFIVSDYVLLELETLLIKVELKCIDIGVRKEKIKFLKLNDMMSKAVKLIIEQGYSCLPIIDDSYHVLGAVTEKGLISIMYEKDGHFNYDENVKVGSELDNFYIVDDNPLEFFIFKSKYDLVEDVRNEIETTNTNKRFGACFITEHGLKSESILSMFTMWDVRKLND